MYVVTLCLVLLASYIGALPFDLAIAIPRGHSLDQSIYAPAWLLIFVCCFLTLPENCILPVSCGGFLLGVGLVALFPRLLREAAYVAMAVLGLAALQAWMSYTIYIYLEGLSSALSS